MIEYHTFNSPIGEITITAVKEGVIRISFYTEAHGEIVNFREKYLGSKITHGKSYTNEAKGQILEYLSGNRKVLDFPVIHLNSPFRKKVLEAQRKIPYGETHSYGEVAKMVNNPRASRAVGSANAENPLPLYFPCHRIISSTGKLGGFGGGLPIKKFLLDLEGKNKTV